MTEPPPPPPPPELEDPLPLADETVRESVVVTEFAARSTVWQLKLTVPTLGVISALQMFVPVQSSVVESCVRVTLSVFGSEAEHVRAVFPPSVKDVPRDELSEGTGLMLSKVIVRVRLVFWLFEVSVTVTL